MLSSGRRRVVCGSSLPSRRGKRHDYFTSCLPWPQKGPGVELPLGTSAPISYVGTGNGNPFAVLDSNGDLSSLSAAALGDVKSRTVTGSYFPLIADLSEASAATINSLRQAFQIQRLYERDAHGGSRYVEILCSHFGITNPLDARLQRPEYIGGSSSRVHINPVQQTSSTDATSPQGNLAAFGLVTDTGNGFTKSFVEHCLIMGSVS